MSFIVASYYTHDTIYETIIVNYLMPSLAYHSINSFIFPRNDMGSWKKNVSLQPEVIWTALKTFPNANILWCDSDVVIRYYPHLFNEIPERCDIGLNYTRFEDHYGGVPEGVDMPRPILNTGVIYFKNSPKMVEFVEEWMTRVAKGHPDHRKALEDLIDERLCDNLSYFMIPRAYAYIAETEAGNSPAIQMEDPVIMQFKASNQGKIDLYHLKNFEGEADAT